MGFSSKPGRRFALALAVSVLAHIIAALLMRPSFREVADRAVDLDIVHISPAPPAPNPPAPPPEAPPEPPRPPEKPRIAAAPKARPEAPVAPVAAPPPERPDAGAADAGKALAAAPQPSAGASPVQEPPGGGICLHDLFAFGDRDPAWLLWVSLASFRGTVYERDLSAALFAYQLGRLLGGATGLDPASDVDALFITAESVFDWRTFRVIASHGAGEEVVQSRLERSLGVTFTKTAQGFEAASSGAFRFHLVAGGRVLAVTHEPRADGDDPRSIPPMPAPSPRPALAPNPFGAPAAAHDAGVPTPPPARPPGAHPEWPAEVRCLEAQPKVAPASSPQAPALGTAAGAVDAGLLAAARSLVVADAAGHAPVAVLATRDPRAVGLGRSGQRLRFERAVLRGYFTDPVRIEGEIRFFGTPEEVQKFAGRWLRLAKQAAGDPFIAMAGLASVFDKLKIEPAGQAVRISLELRPGEVRAVLVFLELQGEALERQLGK